MEACRVGCVSDGSRDEGERAAGESAIRACLERDLGDELDG